MKAIKINPFDQTTSMIELDSDDLASVRQHLSRPEADIEVSFFDVFRFGGDTKDIIYVDDEGLFQQNQAFFRVGAIPLAGIGLLVGTGHDGEDTDPNLSLAQIDYLFERNVFSWVKAENPSLAADQALREIAIANEIAAQTMEASGHTVKRTPFGFITQIG